MSSQQQIIKSIEVKLNTKLEKLTEISWFKKGYVCDGTENIVGLSLYDSKISKLPKELKGLKHLEVLNLNDNEISDISNLKNLINLRKLYLDNNKIQDLSSLQNAKKMTNLHFDKNKLTEIRILSKLQNLEKLHIKNNKIADLTPLKNQNNLLELLISNNRISDISIVKSLKNLKKIDCSGNEIIDILPVTNLERLTEINFSNNKIEILPPKLFDMDLQIVSKKHYFNKGVNIYNNPFAPPSEIILQGREAIQIWNKRNISEKYAHLKEESKNYEIKATPETQKQEEQPIQNGEVQFLNEAKLLLIGNGASGKTSLLKRLISDEHNENEEITRGITIDSWLIKDIARGEIKLNIWDFGGQESMHATHKFFLSKRSFYILVLDSRTESKSEEYWLKHVENYGGNSPVIVAINKIDENKNFDIDQKILKKSFPNIVAFHKISCKTGEGIEEFKQSIIKNLNKIELLNSPIPNSWNEIKKETEALKNINYINPERFSEICERNDVFEKKEQNIVLKFLHDLGIILHFDSYELADTNIINPQWITKAVYKLLTSSKIYDNKGRFTRYDLKELLDENEYPSSKYYYITALMQKFEICYKVKETFIIPELLPSTKPNFDFDLEKALKYKIEYDFLPTSVISSLMVKHYLDIKKSKQWRTGMLLTDSITGSFALINSNVKDNSIEINILGNRRKDYFSVIHNSVVEINNSFQNIKSRDYIACNCKNCKKSTEPFYHKYETIIKRLEKGKDEVICGKSSEDIAIANLFGTFIQINKKYLSDNPTKKEIAELKKLIENGFSINQSTTINTAKNTQALIKQQTLEQRKRINQLESSLKQTISFENSSLKKFMSIIESSTKKTPDIQEKILKAVNQNAQILNSFDKKLNSNLISQEEQNKMLKELDNSLSKIKNSDLKYIIDEFDKINESKLRLKLKTNFIPFLEFEHDIDIQNLWKKVKSWF